MDRTSDIRRQFKDAISNNQLVPDKSGVNVVEIIGATFIADEDAIFGTVNEDYVKREIDWYNTSIPSISALEDPPQIWKAVAGENGYVNSNYGHCIYSLDNFNQYFHAVRELKWNSDSRRAIMIYTRPNIQVEWNKFQCNDFICTNTVQYLIRDGKLHAIVNMRSNDAVFGYKNDRAWQIHVLNKMADELDVEVGDLIWQTGSLHVYERHFSLIL